MSNHAKVNVFYGLVYDHGSADAARFEPADDEEADNPKGDAPGALRNKWPNDGPLQVVRIGHYDLPSIGLAVTASVAKGSDWSALPLPTIYRFADDWDELLKTYCERHGLTYTRPRWYAAPYYG